MDKKEFKIKSKLEENGKTKKNYLEKEIKLKE